MPDYGGSVNPWAGGFKVSSPGGGTGAYSAAAQSAENEFFAAAGTALASGVAHGIETGVKAYENKQVVKEGEAAVQKFQGQETTNVQASEAVAGFEQATANREGLNTAQLKDLDEKALRTFGTDMRKISSLLEAKKISSTQANAQAQTLMQNALSNPRTAAFTEKYRQLAAPLLGTVNATTGGHTYFDQTPEEKAKAALAKGAIEDAVKRQSAINELKANFGFNDIQAEGFMRQYAMREERVKQANASAAISNATTAGINANMAQIGMQSYYKYQASMSNIQNTAEKFSISVSGIINQNNGTIPEELIPKLKDAQEQIYVNTIKNAAGLTPEHQRAVMEAADFQRQRFNKMFDDRSSLEALIRANKDLTAKTDKITGEGIYSLTSAMPDVASAYKLNPEYGKFYTDLRSGSLSAGMKAAKDPWLANIKDRLGKLDANKLATEAATKIANGDGNLTSTEALGFSTRIATPGAAAGITKATVENPSVLEAIRATYATEGTNLSVFNNSLEWKAAMKTKEGQKTVAEALHGITEQARAMQIRKGLPTRGLSIERNQITDELTGISSIRSYNIKSAGIQLDAHVANNLGQAVQILDQNPEICKLMGFENADAWLEKVFDVGTNMMSSPRIQKPTSLPSKEQK